MVNLSDMGPKILAQLNLRIFYDKKNLPDSIPAANYHFSLEVDIFGRKDHKKGKECCVVTLKKTPVKRSMQIDFP